MAGFNHKFAFLSISTFLIFQSVFLVVPKSAFAISLQDPNYVQEMMDYSDKQWLNYVKNNPYLNQTLTPKPTPTLTPTPTPFPILPASDIKYLDSFTPKTSLDYQQLQLLHQIRNGQLPLFNLYLLEQIMNFPLLSIQNKLDLYHFFSSLPVLSSIHLSPLGLSVLVLLLPALTILIPFLLLFITYLLIRNAPGPISFVLGRFNKTEEDKAYLELTFPSNTAKSALATEQLYKLLHTRGKKQSFLQSLAKHKKIYSLEIVSSRDMGIRYIMAVPKREANLIHQNLLAYLPGLKVKEVTDYLDIELGSVITNLTKPSKTTKTSAITIDGEDQKETVSIGVVDLKLAGDFALPLQDQKILDEHDPISFLTGNMTKLYPGELIVFQIVTTPVISSIHGKVEKRIRKLRRTIAQGKPLTQLLQPSPLDQFLSVFPVNVMFFGFKIALWVTKNLFLFLVSIPFALFDSSGKSVPILMTPKIELPTPLDSYEQEYHRIVKEKLDQHLFETSIRVLIVVKDANALQMRADSILASVGPFTSTYQSLSSRSSILPSAWVFKSRLNQLKQRTLSVGLSFNPILSSSEMADLYHFPYTDITKTEGLVKSKSKDLPTPLSMKKSTTKFDVIIGKNTYGGEENQIGLTLEQRQKHTYLVGKTGTGKTTMLKNMIYQDMLNDKGLAVLDPHGDLIKELLSLIPKERIKDVIYLDPSDRDFPIGINILSPGIKFANKDDEQEWITSSVISVFLKLTPKEYWGHRLEHILRNATLTALQTASPTLLTIQRLLTDKSYQKRVSATLIDPVLKQFWEKEFKLFGNMQQAAAISPLTNRLGKFITTKMSRHILLQETSTISIQKIMDEGKILLVNLSKGDLGEDVSFFFGTILTSFIQMAAYQRTKIPESERADFFLYIDEFQNFATPTFSELMSEGRKFHISLIPSHQNIAQIEDINLIKTIVGNANTIICLNASPDDETFILPFMEPEVEKGEIVNLVPYQFFIKAHNEYSEDAFSGETIRLDVKEDQKIKDAVISNTRKRYGLPRQEVEKYVEELFAGKDINLDKTKPKRTEKLFV